MKLINAYCFTDLSDCGSWAKLLRQYIKDRAPAVRGTILLAPEGINISLCGPEEELEQLLALFGEDERFEQMETKIFDIQQMVYNKLKVLLKPEIIAFRNKQYDPTAAGADYVSAEQWNELISAPDTLVLDARNDFEYDMGSFRNAVNPRIERFSHFADYVDRNKEQLAGKKVAIFCTGGIRCEKLGRYMKQQGIEQVYQLKGGILKYLQDIAEQDNLWEGECFVFDERIAVDKSTI